MKTKRLGSPQMGEGEKGGKNRRSSRAQWKKGVIAGENSTSLVYCNVGKKGKVSGKLRIQKKKGGEERRNLLPIDQFLLADILREEGKEGTKPSG